MRKATQQTFLLIVSLFHVIAGIALARLLRSSRYVFTRPDAYGAGASRSSANLIAYGDR